MNRTNAVVAWVLCLACPASAIGQESSAGSAAARLSADDKKEITEVRSLQARLGDEGLGKYVESRLHALVMSQSDAMPVSRMLPRDLFILRSQLGRQNGDLRFYLSGMAQALLLDELNVGWKSRVMARGVYLEDLLRESVEAAGMVAAAPLSSSGYGCEIASLHGETVTMTRKVKAARCAVMLGPH